MAAAIGIDLTGSTNALPSGYPSRRAIRGRRNRGGAAHLEKRGVEVQATETVSRLTLATELASSTGRHIRLRRTAPTTTTWCPPPCPPRPEVSATPQGEVLGAAVATPDSPRVMEVQPKA
jgi:hypothetical protein